VGCILYSTIRVLEQSRVERVEERELWDVYYIVLLEYLNRVEYTSNKYTR